MREWKIVQNNALLSIEKSWRAPGSPHVPVWGCYSVFFEIRIKFNSK